MTSSSDAVSQPHLAGDVDELQAFTDQINSVVDESKVRFEDERLRTRAVDPANVAMIDVKLSEDGFEAWEGEGVIGLNIRQMMDVLDASKAGQFEIDADTDARKLHVQLGEAKFQLATIDPEALREEPDLPDLDLNAEVMLQASRFKRIVAQADTLTDRVRLGWDDREYEFFASAEGSTDTFDLRVHSTSLVDVKSDGPADSLFSLDYLKNAAEVVPEDAIVTLRIGEEFPMKLTYSFGPSQNGSVEYMQAPRILSD